MKFVQVLFGNQQQY